MESIVGPLKKRQFKGVLVDTYVAGAMKEFSSEELRVNKIIDHNSYYGVVFGDGRLSEKTFQNCFEDYFLSNQAGIFEIVKQNTKPMEVSLFGSLLNLLCLVNESKSMGSFLVILIFWGLDKGLHKMPRSALTWKIHSGQTSEISKVKQNTSKLRLLLSLSKD